MIFGTLLLSCNDVASAATVATMCAMAGERVEVVGVSGSMFVRI